MEVLPPSRSLGSAGPRCAVLGLGTGKLRSASSGLSSAEAVRLIHHAADCGMNLIDTADSYGQGESEIAVGRAIRGRREKFILATKAGFRFSASGSLIRLAKPLLRGLVRRLSGINRAVSRARWNATQLGMLRQDFAPAVIAAAVEASLRRLGTDYLDVFFLHEATLEAVRDGALWEMLLRLRAEGKIRCLGISSNDPVVLEASLALPSLGAIETAIHPERPTELWPVLEKFAAQGGGVVANHIFRGGRLLGPETGKDALATCAEALGLASRQLLFAFALGAPGVGCVLTGTTQTVHLDENLADLRVLAARPMPDWPTLRQSFPTSVS